MNYLIRWDEVVHEKLFFVDKLGDALEKVDPVWWKKVLDIRKLKFIYAILHVIIQTISFNLMTRPMMVIWHVFYHKTVCH